MSQLDETLTKRLEAASSGRPTIRSTTGTRAAIEALLVRIDLLEGLVADLTTQVRGLESRLDVER